MGEFDFRTAFIVILTLQAGTFALVVTVALTLGAILGNVRKMREEITDGEV